MPNKRVVNEADYDWFKAKMAKYGQAAKNLAPGGAGAGTDYREAGANKAAELFKTNIRNVVNELQRDLSNFSGQDPQLEAAVKQLILDLEPLVSSPRELK